MPFWDKAAGALKGAAGGWGSKLERGLFELGSVGERSGTTRGMLEHLPASTAGRTSKGQIIGGNAAVEARRSQLQGQLINQGKRRALVGGAGLGAIGMSSGASGMRAKSSGGYTG